MTKEIFKGLKVLDFTWVVAGPWVVKYLADHGAEIVHVESSLHPDLARAAPPFKDKVVTIDNSAYFANYHCNQYGLSINMKHPKAMPVIKKLIAWADVVADNFTPGAMEKWGLGYDEMGRINPKIIWMSLSQLGETGPFAKMPGTGIQLTGLTGIASLAGWPDRDPAVLHGGYTDCAGARFATCALLAALIHRHKTGKGQRIDVSEYEAGVHLVAGPILNYSVTGKVEKRQGNRSDFASPQGVYPCKGEERWIAITVSDEAEWEALCEVMGEPRLAQDKKFAGFKSRKANEDELDERIASWTKTMTREEAMKRLQAKGVPAGMVNDGRDIYEDRQLAHRGFFWGMDHPNLGRRRFESEAFDLSKTPRRLRWPSPLIGEHNEKVCCDILGMSQDEFVELLIEQVLE
jgi:benzylsuccinate CoA-transferase BbsF subunit